MLFIELQKIRSKSLVQGPGVRKKLYYQIINIK